DPARAAGPRPDARAPSLCRRRASARRPESRSSRCRGDEPQEQGGCLMSDNRQSLSDLAKLTQAEPEAEAPATAPEAAETAEAPAEAADGAEAPETAEASEAEAEAAPEAEA